MPVENWLANLRDLMGPVGDWLALGIGLLRRIFVILYQLIPDFPHKRQIIFAALLLIVVSAITISIIRMLKKMRKDPVRKGEKFLKKGKYEKAKASFMRAENPLRTAQACLKLEQYEEAAELFFLAKEYDSAAKYYAHVGELEKAADILLQVGRTLDAAELLEKDGHSKKAADLYRSLRHFKKAEEMYLKVEYYRSIAEMYQDEFNNEQARATGEKQPSSKTAESLKLFSRKSGDFFMKVPDYPHAADIYIAGQHHSLAADALEKNGNFEEAAKLYEESHQLPEAAKAYLSAHQYQSALNIFEQLKDHANVAQTMEYMGKSKEAAEYRANIELQHGHKQEAAQKFEEAGKSDEAAKIHLELKDYAKAAQLYEAAGDMAMAGEAYQTAGDYEKAAAAFEKANRYTAAAHAYREIGNHAKHTECLIAAGSFLEAGLALEERDEDAAIDILQRIDEESPDYRFACNLLGRLFKKKNITSLALEKLEKSIEGQELNKRNLDFYYDLACFKQDNSEETDAFKLFERILSVDYHYKDVKERRTQLEEKLSPSLKEAIEKTAYPMSNKLPRGGFQSHPEMKPVMLSDRYEMVGEIGRGGMGVVYKAWDTALERDVALKFLPAELSAQQHDVEKFMNEARSAARLNHANIVTIHDVNIDQETQNPFIVMEFVDGVNLKDIIDAASNLPFDSIKLIGRQVCEALAYAHQHQVVHRDIKSANILWTNDKLVKVTDFGLAKILREGIITTTRVQGSPVYMSPEQVLGGDIDYRSDLYSFGISLYEMTTGQVPFSRGDIGYHHLNTVPTPPEELREDIPSYLLNIIKKCIEKKPDDRYQNAADLMKEFDS